MRGSHHLRPPTDRTKILIFPQDNEADAIESEIAIIALLGRKDLGTGCLRNLTDGGDGTSGYRFSNEWRQQRSVEFKGRHLNPTTEFTSESWKGRTRGPQSTQHRRHLSEAKQGMNVGHPNYAREANLGNQYAKGMKHTADWKAIRSAQQKQWWAAKRVSIS